MKKKLIPLALIIAFTISFLGCENKSSKTTASDTAHSSSPVSIENVSDKYYKVVIDYTSGVSPKEMGKLLGHEIKEKVPDFERNVDSYLYELCISYNLSYPIQKERVNKIIKNVDKDYVDELNGLASTLSGGDNSEPGDGKLSKSELYLINLFLDASAPAGCSAFSIYGSRSIDGKTITGRHLDWLMTRDHALEKLSAVIEYKQGNKSIYSMGFLGFNGVLTGFNKDKVFGAIIASPTDEPTPKDFDSIRSCTFDLRHALENNKSIDSAAAYLSDENKLYAFENNIFFSDPTTSKVLENNLRGTGSKIRRDLRTDASELNNGITWNLKDSIASVNAFVIKGNYDNMTKLTSNTARWDSYKRLIANKKAPLTFNDVKEVLSFTNVRNRLPGTQEDGSLYNLNSIQSIIFKPDEFKLQVHFAPRKTFMPVVPDFIDIPVDFK